MHESELTLTTSTEYAELFRMMGKNLLADHIGNLQKRIAKAATDYVECDMKIFQAQYKALKEIECIAQNVMRQGW